MNVSQDELAYETDHTSLYFFCFSISQSSPVPKEYNYDPNLSQIEGNNNLWTESHWDISSFLFQNVIYELLSSSDLEIRIDHTELCVVPRRLFS